MSIQINLYFLHKNKKNVFYSKIYIIYQKLFIFTLFFTFRLLSFLNFKDKKKSAGDNNINYRYRNTILKKV